MKYIGNVKSVGCLPGNAFSCNCDNGASGGRTGVGDTSGIMLTSPGRFVEYGSRITFNDVHLNECIRNKETKIGKNSIELMVSSRYFVPFFFIDKCMNKMF